MSGSTVGSWPLSRKPGAVFVDRSIGKRTAFGLAILGLHPVWIGDVYENDGKLVDDVVWIPEASRLGYPILTKDRRIWVNPHEVDCVLESDARVFVVGDGNISSVRMALLFGRHFLPVRRRMNLPGGCLWILRPGKPIDRQHESRR